MRTRQNTSYDNILEDPCGSTFLCKAKLITFGLQHPYLTRKHETNMYLNISQSQNRDHISQNVELVLKELKQNYQQVFLHFRNTDNISAIGTDIRQKKKYTN